MSGKGIARRAVEPVARAWAARTVVRMVGVWGSFVVGGGHGGLIEAGVARSNVYRYAEEFRKVMGAEVEHFVFNTEDARLLIDYLNRHQSPDARRLFGTPTRVGADR
jgi:hypothetical protein